IECCLLGTGTRRMRIGFIIPYFYPAFEYGGTPRVAYEFARCLVRRGHEVTVVTTDSGDRRGSAKTPLPPFRTTDSKAFGFFTIPTSQIISRTSNGCSFP